jgi:hypothetical protein
MAESVDMSKSKLTSSGDVASGVKVETVSALVDSIATTAFTPWLRSDTIVLPTERNVRSLLTASSVFFLSALLSATSREMTSTAPSVLELTDAVLKVTLCVESV